MGHPVEERLRPGSCEMGCGMGVKCGRTPPMPGRRQSHRRCLVPSGVPRPAAPPVAPPAQLDSSNAVPPSSLRRPTSAWHRPALAPITTSPHTPTPPTSPPAGLPPGCSATPSPTHTVTAGPVPTLSHVPHPATPRLRSICLTSRSPSDRATVTACSGHEGGGPTPRYRPPEGLRPRSCPGNRALAFGRYRSATPLGSPRYATSLRLGPDALRPGHL